MFWQRVPRRWIGDSKHPTIITQPTDETELSVDGCWQPTEMWKHVALTFETCFSRPRWAEITSLSRWTCWLGRMTSVPSCGDRKLAFPTVMEYFVPVQISSVLSLFSFSWLAEHSDDFLRFWSGAVNVTDKLLSFSNIYCFISRQKMPLWRYFHSRQIQTLWTRQTIAQHLLMPLWVCLSNDCIEGNCTDRVLCSIGSMYSQNCPFPSGI